MTTPRTIAGQAALSGTRPHVRRWLAQTISTIEEEAIRPYVDALRAADRVLAALAAGGEAAPSEIDWAGLVGRAAAAHRLAAPLLESHADAGPG